MNSTTPTVQPSGLSRQQWWMIAACVALLLGLQLWLFRPIIGDYFPTLDETAVQAGSTPIGGSINPVLWFLHGFQGYFVPYPEWSTTATDFWRPLVKVYYWASYYTFGHHWTAQPILGYAAHAIIVGLIGYLALAVLRLNSWLAIAAMAIAIFNPATCSKMRCGIHY